MRCAKCGNARRLTGQDVNQVAYPVGTVHRRKLRESYNTQQILQGSETNNNVAQNTVVFIQKRHRTDIHRELAELREQ